MALTKYFKDIPEIAYEGPLTDNPFAYRWYNADEEVAGKTMAEWLRASVCYWHTFRGAGGDQFGSATIERPWGDLKKVTDYLKLADVAFDFISRLNVPFYCFHDRDVAPEGKNVKETNENLWKIAEHFKKLQGATGVKLLWGTANLFSHPRFSQGASTSPSADVFAYCANSVKEMIDVTKFLGGENYVFWGGREGYNSLLNTDMGRELDHMATFLHMAVDYAKKVNFTGQFLIEPKPKEPTKHQYDSDTGAVLGFLRKAKLDKHFKMNIEANHATLAGHDFCHELEFCRINGVLGSIDANRGDLMLGWDTDQFPNDHREAAQAMISVIKNGGLGTGGLNFDAKLRRDSYDIEDMFFAHIGGIDTFARGLRIAATMIEEQTIDEFIADRYSSFDSGIGKDIESGKADFTSLQKYILKQGETEALPSGRQELLENIFNTYV